MGEKQRKGNALVKAAAGEGEKHLSLPCCATSLDFHIQRAVYSSILMVGLKKEGLEDLKEILVVIR